MPTKEAMAGAVDVRDAEETLEPRMVIDAVDAVDRRTGLVGVEWFSAPGSELAGLSM